MYVKKHPDHIDMIIMQELKRYPPSTMRYIAQVVGRSHVSIRQRYQWLEEQGYITQAENAPKNSARSKILTQQGFEYLANGVI